MHGATPPDQADTAILPQGMRSGSSRSAGDGRDEGGKVAVGAAIALKANIHAPFAARCA